MRRYSSILAVLVVLFPVASHAQDSARIVIISPRVGTAIDRAERDMYGLFRSLPDFQSATFFSHSGRYYGLVALRAGDSARDTLIEYREHALVQMAERIENHDALVAGTYSMGQTPPALVFGIPMRMNELAVDTARLRGLPQLENNAPAFTGKLPGTASSSQRKLGYEDTLKLIILRVHNGSIRRDRALIIDTSAWKMTVEKPPISPAPEGSEYGYGDPSSFNNIFFPTAFTIRGGVGYVSFDQIILVGGGKALSDRLTLTMGAILAPPLIDEIGLPFHIGWKIRVYEPIDDATIAIGMTGFGVLARKNSLLILLPFLVVTGGDDDMNISMTGGYYQVPGRKWGLLSSRRGSISDMGEFASFGGQARLAKHVKFLAEVGTLFAGNSVPLTLGVRLFGRRWSCDFYLGKDIIDGGMIFGGFGIKSFF